MLSRSRSNNSPWHHSGVADRQTMVGSGRVCLKRLSKKKKNKNKIKSKSVATLCISTCNKVIIQSNRRRCHITHREPEKDQPPTPVLRTPAPSSLPARPQHAVSCHACNLACRACAPMLVRCCSGAASFGCPMARPVEVTVEVVELEAVCFLCSNHVRLGLGRQDMPLDAEESSFAHANL